MPVDLARDHDREIVGKKIVDLLLRASTAPAQPWASWRSRRSSWSSGLRRRSSSRGLAGTSRPREPCSAALRSAARQAARLSGDAVDSRAAWRAALRNAAEHGSRGLLVPANPRLLDLLRN